MIPLAAVIAAATAIGVGAEHRFSEASERAARRLMTLVLWVLMPVVAFFNVNALEIDTRVGAGLAFGYAGVAVAFAAAYLVGSRLLALERPAVGALMVAAALPNTGYLGLPFTAAVFGFDELPSAVAFDVLVSGLTTITVGFSIGAAFGTVGERPRERIAAFFARNPPLWATAAALVAPAALAPDWAVDGSQLLVFAILPLGFFAVGVTLAAEAEEDRVSFPPPLSAPVAWAVALKLVVPPALMLGLAAAIVDVPDSYVTQAGMASAIITLLIANEYGLDRRIAAGAIAWSTALVVAAGLVAALV